MKIILIACAFLTAGVAFADNVTYDPFAWRASILTIDPDSTFFYAAFPDPVISGAPGMSNYEFDYSDGTYSISPGNFTFGPSFISGSLNPDSSTDAYAEVGFLPGTIPPGYGISGIEFQNMNAAAGQGGVIIGLGDAAAIFPPNPTAYSGFVGELLSTVGSTNDMYMRATGNAPQSFEFEFSICNLENSCPSDFA